MASPTIYDLAKALGLSKSTVAAALNGTGRIAEETRARVHAAATELGYAANANARRLRTRSGGMVGLYVPEDIREMDFYAGFVFGAVESAGRRGLDLAIVTTVPRDPSSWMIFNGIVVIDAVYEDPMLQSLARSGVAVVAAGHLDQRFDQHLRAKIAIDHERQAVEMFKELATAGSTHPALIGAQHRDENSWSSRISDGYRSWTAGQGIEPIMRTLPPFAGNAELHAALDDVLTSSEVDGLVFGWQDAAERAQLVLNYPSYADRDLTIGAYLSRDVEAARHRFDVSINLDPHRFGEATVEVLVEALSSQNKVLEVVEFQPTLLRRA